MLTRDELDKMSFEEKLQLLSTQELAWIAAKARVYRMRRMQELQREHGGAFHRRRLPDRKGVSHE